MGFLSRHNINGLIDCATSNYENLNLGEEAKIISIVDMFGREVRSKCNSICFTLGRMGRLIKVILNK